MWYSKVAHLVAGGQKARSLLPHFKSIFVYFWKHVQCLLTISPSALSPPLGSLQQPLNFIFFLFYFLKIIHRVQLVLPLCTYEAFC